MAKRPTTLDQFIGQSRIRPLIAAEMRSGKQFRHTLLFGMPGTGKSSLAGVLGNVLGYEVKSFVASSEWTGARVMRMLLDLSTDGYDRAGRPGPHAKRFLIFCDEIHKLPDFESWYTALEDCEVYVGGKPSWLPFLTVVGATTEPTLAKPFRDRFPLQFHLEPYSLDEMASIVKLSYPKMKDAWVQTIVERSRGVPRLALSHAESVELMGSLDLFDIIGVDELGLNELDRRYIEALRKGEGRPLSVSTLGAMCMEQPKTLTTLVEPFLLQIGLIEITPRGRVLIEQSTRGRRQA